MPTLAGQSFVASAVLIAALAARAPAQRVDSAAVAVAIAKSIVLDMNTRGDHRGPVFITTSADSLAPWRVRIVDAIRQADPKQLLTKPIRLGLQLELRGVTVTDEVIQVQGEYSKCVSASTWNYWGHDVQFVIPRAGGAWQPQSALIRRMGDGRCPPDRS